MAETIVVSAWVGDIRDERVLSLADIAKAIAMIRQATKAAGVDESRIRIRLYSQALRLEYLRRGLPVE